MGTELEQPVPYRTQYTIGGEEWVATQVVYHARPGERMIELTLQPLEEVQARNSYVRE